MFETFLYQDIPTALLVDLVVLSLCTLALLRYGRLSHSHPAITYLVFHTVVVPFRLLAIWSGAETLFSAWSFSEAVTEPEIVRAAFLFDLTLIIMTIAWIRASAVDSAEQRPTDQGRKQATTLSLPRIWSVVFFAFPVGVAGLLLLGNIPGFEKPTIDLGDWETSSWLAITIAWSGLAVVALIYWYGFRWWLLVPMTFYLFLMAVQGFHRFRFIIPLILLTQIYLDRKGKKWPTPLVLGVLIGMFVLFFPLKQIGMMAQTGASFSEIRATSSVAIERALAGEHTDQELLDQTASCLTLVDRSGRFYYGTPYLALLTAPIPRQWWPEKPGLADYLKEISSTERPMDQLGMVVGFVGDFYLNFGYLGVIILSFIFAHSFARIYFKAYRAPYFSVIRFAYLMIACNFIEIYRDGLMSIIIFTCVNMMPLVVIVILNSLNPIRRRIPAHSPVPLHGALDASR